MNDSELSKLQQELKEIKSLVIEQNTLSRAILYQLIERKSSSSISSGQLMGLRDAFNDSLDRSDKLSGPMDEMKKEFERAVAIPYEKLKLFMNVDESELNERKKAGNSTYNFADFVDANLGKKEPKHRSREADKIEEEIRKFLRKNNKFETIGIGVEEAKKDFELWEKFCIRKKGSPLKCHGMTESLCISLLLVLNPEILK